MVYLKSSVKVNCTNSSKEVLLLIAENSNMLILLQLRQVVCYM